ncbi:hypothetical protein SAMN04489867_2125 [Pedococcus dokdonensis]|uniref:Uncharacterized protein n=1 Tax=Pedococcus dokdonensis TaxID=443156 RepID=A0A1H0RXU1_9MICO|nr:hypothetical protein [Pedococcus dokdonensis]SDP34195.1 hypothetical protein SAMN04489867_2125 [Pedococcus dokdonensis]
MTKNDAHDDPTFDTSTTDDTTQLEQTVHTDRTEQLDTTERTEQLDTTEATRAIAVDEPATPRDLFGNPVVGDERTEPVGTAHGSHEHPATPLPERPTGPHAPAIVLGLVCMVVAGIILGQELGDLSVDWGDVGPVGIVVTGAVLVLFGLVGLLSSRRGARTP